MFECVAFSSLPEQSTVPSRSSYADRVIIPAAANWVIKSKCVVVCVVEEFVPSEAVFIVVVSRKVTNLSLPQVVNLGDRVDGVASARGDVDMRVVDVDVCPIVGFADVRSYAHAMQLNRSP